MTDAIAALGKKDIVTRNPSTVAPPRRRFAERGRRRLHALSEDDWTRWTRDGYVVVRNAVEPALADALAHLAWTFEELDPHDRGTWYPAARTERRKRSLAANAGMVELYNHPLMWQARQSPRIHDAFADLWGTRALWVSIDRMNFMLPQEPDVDFRGFMHWDHDPEGEGDNVQGVLAVTDQRDPAVGGFQCIPELFRDYAAWRATQPPDRDWYRPDVGAFTPTPVPLARGDLLVFNSRLCHGIRPNVSAAGVRIAQYIAMTPAQEDDAALRDWRVACWRERRAPSGYSLEGDPRDRERRHGAPAPLSPLGERLLGLRGWHE
jgi:ectoine hydroxylase-related dioxygenase (phytanoyl-CoA dioxygenase family)